MFDGLEPFAGWQFRVCLPPDGKSEEVALFAAMTQMIGDQKPGGEEEEGGTRMCP